METVKIGYEPRPYIVPDFSRRVDWHEFFMKEAEHWATLSTCCKWKVGCVVTRDNRIVSTGYNGVISGARHCEDYWDTKKPEFRTKHREWSRVHEMHAEQNALSFAAKQGIKTDAATLYTTVAPCPDCAKSILVSGIRQVYYRHAPHREGVEFLTMAGVTCRDMSPIRSRYADVVARLVEFLNGPQTDEELFWEISAELESFNQTIETNPDLWARYVVVMKRFESQ